MSVQVLPPVEVAGREYTIRITDLPMIVNGLPTDGHVDVVRADILLFDNGQTARMVLLTGEALKVAWMYETSREPAPADLIVNLRIITDPSASVPCRESSPSGSAAPRLRVVLSGCCPVGLAYPATLDPQWQHLAAPSRMQRTPTA